MQTFYDQLFSSSSPNSSVQQMLAQVAALSRAQLKTLASYLDWNGWGQP